MLKVVTVGATALFACILCATPLSLRLSPEGKVTLSVDSASAEIGRTPHCNERCGREPQGTSARVSARELR